MDTYVRMNMTITTVIIHNNDDIHIILEWFNAIVPQAGSSIKVLLQDSTYNSIFSGTAVTNRYYYPLYSNNYVSSYGAFEVVVKLPDNVNLGSATMTFELYGERHQHTIDIQEVSNG